MVVSEEGCEAANGLDSEEESIKRRTWRFLGLGNIFDEMEKDGAALDIDRAVNLIFTFFILSQETTPGVLGAVVNLVADHPSVMEELQVLFSY